MNVLEKISHLTKNYILKRQKNFHFLKKYYYFLLWDGKELENDTMFLFSFIISFIQKYVLNFIKGL